MSAIFFSTKGGQVLILLPKEMLKLDKLKYLYSLFSVLMYHANDKEN